jgi:hypothetical protein
MSQPCQPPISQMRTAKPISLTTGLRRVKLVLTDVDGTERWNGVRPHPDPLPQEREQPSQVATLRTRVEPPAAASIARRRRAFLPLHGGEGRGEGERPIHLNSRAENIQHPTSNNQHPMLGACRPVGCLMLNVGCWMLVPHVGTFRTRVEPPAATSIARRRRTFLPLPGGEGRGEGERSIHLNSWAENIQQPTSNAQHPRLSAYRPVGCSMLNVGCWMFPL